MRDRLWTWAILLGVPTACIALLIDRRSMWLDEVTSVYVANRDLAGMVEILRHVDAVFALYYGLLHAWLIFGDGAVSVRMLSAIFALGTLPVAYAIAHRLAGRNVAFLSALTLGTSFIFLRYAVEARPYSLEFLLCAVSAFFFLKAKDQPRLKTFAAYVAATLGAIYAHPLAIVWLIAQAASIPFLPRSTSFVKGMVLSWTGIAAGLLPLVALVRMNGTHQIDWIQPMSFGRLLSELEYLVAGISGGPFHHHELAILVAVLIVAGFVALWRAPRPRVAFLLLTWFLLPLAVMAIVSVWKPIEQVYYFRYTILPACILAAAAVQSLGQKFGPVIPATLVALLIAGGVTQMIVFRGEDWRATNALLVRCAAPSDGLIVYTPNVVRALRYAEHERRQSTRATRLYPTGLVWRGDIYMEPFPGDLPLKASRTYRRLWVVLSHRKDAWKRVVLQPLYRYYSDVSAVQLGNVEVRELKVREKFATAVTVRSGRSSP